MSVVELGVNVSAAIAISPCVEQQELVRPVLELSPIDSVVQKITAIPGEFSLTTQIYVLKAHGLESEEIRQKLYISEKVMSPHTKQAKERFGSTIGVIKRLVDIGEISADLLTEGLDFFRYKQLTSRQKKMLDLMLEGYSNMKLSAAVNVRRSQAAIDIDKIYTTLGVANRTQAIVYRLFIPEEKRLEGEGYEEETISANATNAFQLRMHGYTRDEIARIMFKSEHQ